MESLGAAVLLAVAWLVVVAVLVLDLTGRWRRAGGFRWQAVGLLLGIGAVLTSAVARLRGWPDGQLHGFLIKATVAGAVLILVGAFVPRRTVRRGRGPAE